MSFSITADSTIVRNGEVLDAERDECKILFHPGAGLYCDLDKTGTHVWGLLEGARDFEDLVTALAAHYSADRNVCRADTLAFLTVLAEQGFVSVERRRH